jgi:hypothetical protein
MDGGELPEKCIECNAMIMKSIKKMPRTFK